MLGPYLNPYIFAKIMNMSADILKVSGRNYIYEQISLIFLEVWHGAQSQHSATCHKLPSSSPPRPARDCDSMHLFHFFYIFIHNNFHHASRKSLKTINHRNVLHTQKMGDHAKPGQSRTWWTEPSDLRTHPPDIRALLGLSWKWGFILYPLKHGQYFCWLPAY